MYKFIDNISIIMLNILNIFIGGQLYEKTNSKRCKVI